ncbi:MAG: hypothetical protein KBT68_05915 [bacterium]|nr:hypothetical protein [Candidatus Colisoma equi]
MRNKKSDMQMGCKAIVVAAFVASGITFGATSGEVAATVVTAQQRYPWNGLVDISVTISGTSNVVAEAVCTFAATNCATRAALKVLHLTGVSEVSGSGNTWTRRFVWNAAADVGEMKIGDIVLAVEVETQLSGVQLWANGPYWAECNVGATKPEEYGYYFWWGDTVGYTPSGGNRIGWYYSDVTWVSSKGETHGRQSVLFVRLPDRRKE